MRKITLRKKEIESKLKESETLINAQKKIFKTKSAEIEGLKK
jgi:hypothetical protein